MQEYVSSQTSEGSLGLAVSSALFLAGAGLRTGIYLLRHRAMWCAEKTGRYDAIYSRWFLEGVFKKAYPQEAMDGLAHYMPAGFEKDFETIAAPPDWIGVNYYTRKIVGDNPTEQLPMVTRLKAISSGHCWITTKGTLVAFRDMLG